MAETQITVLLKKLGQGEKDLLDDIYSLLYDEIKKIAYNQINQLNTGETLTPTVIANECYIKLARQNDINLSNKRHFLNYLAKSMRLMLIDTIRTKSSEKNKHIAVEDNISIVVGDQDVNLKWIDIDIQLNKVERINKQFSEILEYKLIFNFTFFEIAEIMELSERQIMRIWKQATALLMALASQYPAI